MKKLKTLVAMQLRDKVDFSYLASKKKTIFKVVLTLLKFGIITAAIYLVLFILVKMNLVSLLPGIPSIFIGAVFSLMMILSIVVCTLGLMRSLYFDRDNQVLLTLPTGKLVTFTSKLVVYYIYEYLKNLTYFLPLFVAYGLVNGLPIYYYLFLPFALVWVTAVPVVCGALLSIPAMAINIFLKRVRWLTYTLLAVIVGGGVYSLVKLIASLPSNINLVANWGTTFWQIQDILKKLSLTFRPLYLLCESVLGNRYGIVNNLFYGEQFLYILLFVGVSVVILGLSYLVVSPLYFKMTSSPFEYKKAVIKKSYKNKKLNSTISSVKKDVVIRARTPEKAFGIVAIIICMPIAIFLLNKIYAAMDTRLAGQQMAVTFNILMILLFALSTNTGLSHVYSEEGASLALLKTYPQSHVKLLFSKLVVNIVLVSASLAVTTGVFVYFTSYTVWQGIVLFIAFESIYLTHLLWSAEMDVMNPQSQQYQTTGGEVYNPNEMKSTICLFVLSGIFAFISYFFIKSGSSFILKIAFVGVMLLILRMWLYQNKVSLYFKEKQ